MKKEERVSRIIARGEHSNHSHVVVGDAEVLRNNQGEIIVKVGKEGAMLKHILESNWMEGEEVWTKEHTDIPLKGGSVRHGDVLLKEVRENEYLYVHQNEFDPFEKIVRRVVD
jgi:hypothetical protein